MTCSKEVHSLHLEGCILEVLGHQLAEGVLAHLGRDLIVWAFIMVWTLLCGR